MCWPLSYQCFVFCDGSASVWGFFVAAYRTDVIPDPTDIITDRTDVIPDPTDIITDLTEVITNLTDVIPDLIGDPDQRR